MGVAQHRLVVVGASSLVGRRLPEAMGAPDMTGRFEACFTSRKHLKCAGSVLDLNRPQLFQPGVSFDTAIIACPIWLLTEAALKRFAEMGIGHIIAFSSTSRFTKITSPLDEEREVVDKLIEGEARLAALSASLNIAYTILRPTMIYDPGRDQNISRIVRMIDRLGFFVVCGGAKGLRQPVRADDLARAALQCVGNPIVRDRAYNLSGAERLSYRDMVRRLFKARGHPAIILCLPKMGWKLAFGLARKLWPTRFSGLNINIALRMNVDMAFDHEDATRDFGFAPRGFDVETH